MTKDGEIRHRSVLNHIVDSLNSHNERSFDHSFSILKNSI